MFRKYGLPVLALLGVTTAIAMVKVSNKKPPVPPIPYEPPQSPYTHFIAGEGIIEASSANVAVGVPNGETVSNIYVEVGDIVKNGDPLFKLDTRALEAEYEKVSAEKKVALARLHKLIHSPRQEEIPPFEAIVHQQESAYADALDKVAIYKNVKDVSAISQYELRRLEYGKDISYHRLQEASANLALKKAGAWIEDILIASREVDEKEAVMKKVAVDIEKMTIRAPFDGQVLQLNVHLSEYASGSNQAYQSQKPYLLFGNISPLHVKISIDEEDAWRYQIKTPATAFVRGNSKINFPLTFVSVEPYIVPKQSLTGDNSERVDTRVLQVNYAFERQNLPVYVGQMLDIYLQAPSALP